MPWNTMKDQTRKRPLDPVRDGSNAHNAEQRELFAKCPDVEKAAGAAAKEIGVVSETGVVLDARMMMERVIDLQNLREAWERVRSNKGAPGVDGITIGEFPEFLKGRTEGLRKALLEGRYHPTPVRRVMIPKPDGSERPLGVPTVLDRVVQQALAQVLNPLFDKGFSENSHGFRPGRNAHQAVATVQEAWQARKRYAVDCDLKAFFDTVNHDRLMSELRVKVKDPRVLALIHRFLKAGVVLLDGRFEETSQGVPQGGPLSPLLANIVLDPLDKELERRGHHFARYADDFILLVKSARAAQRVMASVKRFVESKLKLVVNQTKSKTAPLEECSFLGFQITARGKIVWSEKALLRFKKRVREITSRSRGVNAKKMIEELRLYVTGWLGYFGISNTYKELLELEAWIRRKVRAYYWKQWKQPRTRRRHLLALGIRSDEVKLASRSRKGYWRMSTNSIVQRAMTNKWLEEQGIPKMKEQWISLHYDKPKEKRPP
jgi:RNA-directed DNA polymerase